jgi:membrane protein YqaA with SNARE-associated domain
MNALVSLIYLLARLGAPGLLLVGVLDSSFLFLPFGNDLLILGFAAREPEKLAWYASMATLGSVTGSMIVDYIGRKGGEQGLSRMVPAKRLDSVKRKVRTRAGYAIAVAALLPPPFPFTPFVAAAAALQYPRWRMIAVLLSARMLRFCLIGVLGVGFGPAILRLADQPAVKYALVGLFVVCIVGSVISVAGWIRRGRTSGTRAEAVPASS